MEQTTEYRLETLETVLAEFIMQTNRSLNRMERDTSAFKAEMQQLREEQQRKEEQRLAEQQAHQAEQQRKEEQRLAEQQARQAEQQRKEEQRLAEQQAHQAEQQRKEEQRLAEQQRKEEQRLAEQQRKEEQRLAEKKQADAEWKAEKKQMNREWNQKWGEVTEKLGTFAEDLAAPNLKRIAREQFGCESLDYYSVRIDKRNPLDYSQMFEFDAILVAGQTVLLLESKFTVRMKYLEGVPRLIENFKLCFPEYNSYKLIPVFASMSIQPDQVKYLTNQGIYAMALGEENMELLNFDDLQGR
jgi:hypothetical protein